jgi:type I restriction-modification system DNA methylase subunit
METDEIRKTTLWARGVLTEEIGDLLLQVYGLKADGSFLRTGDVPALKKNAEAQETRRRLEKLIDDEKDAGIQPAAAVAKLVKEVAFTHLNRLVALKMLEDPDRHVIRRSVLVGYPEPNGFKMYLPSHDDDYQLYEQGAARLDELDESPRDRAYRHFLLWQYCELAKEVRVLFDPDSLASRLFPRPKVLRQLIDKLNAEDLKEAWKPGNEETIGWVYQFFISDEKAAAFERVFKKKQKFQKADIPAATQVFTPRWVVRFLVENSLGRLWLSMHKDSQLEGEMPYLVPLAGPQPSSRMRSVKEIRLLDPATGTMHFGLVAFDLLAKMYEEEMANAGKPGWPAEPPVRGDQEIPATILANNLFGIDIDLRSVQLSALALYLRAKSYSRGTVLSESNLACADVSLFRGSHRAKIAGELVALGGFNRQLFEQFCDALDEASLMGSLVRVERIFHEKLWADELKNGIDGYVRRKAAEGIDESYFAGESAKGVRLLDVLQGRYDVVFTNPPYMSNRNMNPDMSDFMKRNYKKSKGDLYAGFIDRCSELLVEGGRLAMITQQSFMFISSYEDLRSELHGKAAIETMAHVGPRAFDEVQGEKVNTTVFVLRRETDGNVRRDSTGVYFRLVKEPDAEAKRMAFEQALQWRKRSEPDSRIYEYRQGDFAAIPGSPWVYWIAPRLRALFQNLPKLEDIAEPRVGLQTSDNFRFLRFWWEVGSRRIGFGCKDTDESARRPERWYPYMKGGSFLRWYGNQEHIINYGQNGYEIKAWADPLYGNSGWSRIIKSPDFYFRRGVTYSYLTAGAFNARLSPGGFIFDVAGSSVFPDDVELLLAVLNSRFARYILKLINPTVNFQVGDVCRVPVPKQASGLIRGLVDEVVALSKCGSEEDEITYDFVAPPLWSGGIETVSQRHKALRELEIQIDEEVSRLYEISNEDRQAIETELATPIPNADTDESTEDGKDQTEIEPIKEGPLTQTELAMRWIGYAVGVALARFQPGIESALGCGSFAPEMAAKLRDLTDQDGIMILEEGHPDDLARRILDILTVMYGDTETDQIVRTASGSTAALRDALETYLLGEFFKDHVKRYRKRPIYWLIQSPKKSYSIYLFHEKATADTLPLLRGNRYLGGRLNRLRQDQAARLKAAEDAKRAGDRPAESQARRDASQIAELLEELQEFDRRLEAATRVPIKDENGRDTTARWEPELDDGVYINAAPLHELLPSWREVNPKKGWQELANEEYEWSKTAMRYWPQRVLKKCKENKSYAIAHGLL